MNIIAASSECDRGEKTAYSERNMQSLASLRGIKSLHAKYTSMSWLGCVYMCHAWGCINPKFRLTSRKLLSVILVSCVCCCCLSSSPPTPQTISAFFPNSFFSFFVVVTSQCSFIGADADAEERREKTWQINYCNFSFPQINPCFSSLHLVNVFPFFLTSFPLFCLCSSRCVWTGVAGILAR